MFDIGFLELAVIAVIGLIVIGPERLPEAVRSGATWMAKIRKMMRDTRAEIEVQIGADEIRRELHNEQVMKSLEALKVTKDDIQQHILDADRKMMLEQEAEEAKLQTPVSRRVAGDDPTLGTDDNVFTDPSYAHPPEEPSKVEADTSAETPQANNHDQQPTTKTEPANDR
ncbi:Sec-independent protein translocase protein TatB [Saccharophagus degradans]|uniref:Sec-independent protein translocase protein TatB n=1 Tax=Saccharophagus degradans TaxID=86304 RepID=UPI002477E486|nr:Sec-independent protein translocase protein TatB [Saccharophagus degradans]WGO99323.1 Sec-independent protein translocase protein TatB [Saccharophagus degradans]